MPTYEYRCPEGHEFEKFFRTISGAPTSVNCPTCGKVAERQLSGGAGLLFKGSGFYLTDYGKNAHATKGPKPPTSEGKSAASGGAGESKSSTEGASGGGGNSSGSGQPSSGGSGSANTGSGGSASPGTGSSSSGSSSTGSSGGSSSTSGSSSKPGKPGKSE